MERIRLLRGFRGRAVVFYFESLDDFKYRRMIECIHFLHRCRETVLCDGAGRWEAMRVIDILRAAPGVLFSILLDLKTLIFGGAIFTFALCVLHPLPPIRAAVTRRLPI